MGKRTWVQVQLCPNVLYGSKWNQEEGIRHYKVARSSASQNFVKIKKILAVQNIDKVLKIKKFRGAGLHCESLLVKQIDGCSIGCSGPGKPLVYARVVCWRPFLGPPEYWHLVAWAQLGETEEGNSCYKKKLVWKVMDLNPGAGKWIFFTNFPLNTIL